MHYYQYVACYNTKAYSRCAKNLSPYTAFRARFSSTSLTTTTTTTSTTTTTTIPAFGITGQPEIIFELITDYRYSPARVRELFFELLGILEIPIVSIYRPPARPHVTISGDGRTLVALIWQGLLQNVDGGGVLLLVTKTM